MELKEALRAKDAELQLVSEELAKVRRHSESMAEQFLLQQKELHILERIQEEMEASGAGGTGGLEKDREERLCRTFERMLYHDFEVGESLDEFENWSMQELLDRMRVEVCACRAGGASVTMLCVGEGSFVCRVPHRHLKSPY